MFEIRISFFPKNKLSSGITVDHIFKIDLPVRGRAWHATYAREVGLSL